MLRHTFLCFPGITPTRERRLWAAGVKEWSGLESAAAAGVLKADHAALSAMVPEYERRLEIGDAEFFERRLKGAQKLRLIHDFHGNMAAVDIETSGTNIDAGVTTIIGLCTPDGFHSYVAGSDLEQAPALLAKHAMLVTFNGARFDLPILREEFGGAWGYSGLKKEDTDWGGGQPMLFDTLPAPPAAQAHVDLMVGMREIGYRGGLKKIEKAIGLARPEGIEGFDGYAAVMTWRRWLAVQPQADAEVAHLLKRLIAYNLYDCVSLLIMARFAFNELVTKNGYPFRRFDDVNPYFVDVDAKIEAKAEQALRKLLRGNAKR